MQGPALAQHWLSANLQLTAQQVNGKENSSLLPRCIVRCTKTAEIVLHNIGQCAVEYLTAEKTGNKNVTFLLCIVETFRESNVCYIQDTSMNI